MTECIITVTPYDMPSQSAVLLPKNKTNLKFGNGEIAVEHDRTHTGPVTYAVKGPFPEEGTLLRGQKRRLVVSTKPPVTVDLDHRLASKKTPKKRR